MSRITEIALFDQSAFRFLAYAFLNTMHLALSTLSRCSGGAQSRQLSLLRGDATDDATRFRYWFRYVPILPTGIPSERGRDYSTQAATQSKDFLVGVKVI